MIQKTRAIVLNSIRYQDSSLIVKVFTRTIGIQHLLVQSVGKPKSSFRSSYFLPLNELEIVAYFSQKGLSRLKEVSSIYIPYQTHDHPLKMAVAGFMVEVVLKTLHEGDPQPDIFDFIENETVNLDEAVKVAHIPLLFLYHLSGHLGFQPGTFEELTDNQVILTTVDLRSSFQNLVNDQANMVLSVTEKRKLLEIFLNFFQWHIEGFSTLHSIEVIKEVF